METNPSPTPAPAGRMGVSSHALALLAVGLAAALALVDVVSWGVPPVIGAVIGVIWIVGERHSVSANHAGLLAAAWTLLAGVGYLAVLGWTLPPRHADCQFDCDDAAAFVGFISYASVGLLCILVGVVVRSVRASIERFRR